MSDIYIALTAEDYQCLIAGGKLTVKDKKTSNEIQIILQDIGYSLMHELIERLEDGTEPPFKDLKRSN